MKLIEVFRYELEHRLESRSTWAYAVLLFAFALANAIDVGALDDINANAPHRLAFDAVFTGMLGLVVTAAFFGDAALRDIEVGMDPLLFTSPQRKIDHLGGRYLAALVANALLLLAVPLGYALPALIGYPDPAHFGPFRPAALLQPWIILLVPNAAASGAVLFAVALVSRSLIPVYLTGFALFMGSLLLADIGVNGLDPSAIGTVDAIRPDHWTPAEQNSRLIGLYPPVLWNRLLWLTVTGLVLALLHRHFRFAHREGGGALRERSDAPEPAATVPLRAARVTASFGFRTTARQTLGIARTSLAEVAVNPWTAGVLVVCAIWSASLSENAANLFGAWPVTTLVTAALSRDYVVGLYIVVGFYAGELVWKDRDAKVAEITDAAPVAESTALLGRFLALVALAGMFLMASMAGAMLNQVSHEYYDFDPALYLRVLFGLNLARIALFGALAMTIHVVVNHKYLGHVAMLMATVIPFSGPLLRHYLLVYGGDAGWIHSDMNGFGPFLEPFVWLKLYSAGWALLLGVAASALWVRGPEADGRHRLRQARARFTGPLLRTAGVAAAVILGVGGFIFYNTNVLNAFGADDERSALQAEYEKRYGRFVDAPQPMIERARLRVEIHPDDPAVEVSGSFQLVNRTAARIDSLHVSTNREIAIRAVSFDREAIPVVTDTEVGYRIYALARPLGPGDSMLLSFDVGFRQRGFRNSGIRTDVVSNGTYFGRSWLPFVGYQPAHEPSDAETRARHGLGPRPPLPGPDVVAARGRRHEIRGEDKVRVEMIVGTAPDQIAITSGALRREWMENGRRYFHYGMEEPQWFDAPVFSARYAVRAERWNDPVGSEGGMTLGIYHHPEHDRTLDTFVRGMKASLAYYTAHFGPYGDSVLRIVEVPRYEQVARSHPGIVAYSEHNFITRTKEGQIDHLFLGTAYEIARQWWGGQVRGALGVRGGPGFITESLASYSALMVMENEYGPEAARRLYASRMDDYFTERASAGNEVPLLAVEDQPYIMHGKGTLAMYLMRDYIGEAAVNTALRRFIDTHRAGAPPYPTALDVVAELRAVTPDSLRYLLTDLFETVTVWDLRTDRAVVEPTGTGEYRVTLDVVAKKARSDGDGRETEVPMDDMIEIGAFASAAGGASAEPLYLRQHRIRSGRQTITITVPKEPLSAGIDPSHKLIDRSGRDNVVQPIAGPEARPSRP